MAIGDQIFPIFDADGAPLPSAAPVWVTFRVVGDGTPLTGPNIREVGGGVYAFTPNFTDGDHLAGIIDCGALAQPRYVSWDGRYADLQVADIVARLRAISEGRWKIFTDGVNKNTLVLYGSDGVSVLQQWDLKDALGSPTFASIFERVPRYGV